MASNPLVSALLLLALCAAYRLRGWIRRRTGGVAAAATTTRPSQAQRLRALEHRVRKLADAFACIADGIPVQVAARGVVREEMKAKKYDEDDNVDGAPRGAIDEDGESCCCNWRSILWGALRALRWTSTRLGWLVVFMAVTAAASSLLVWAFPSLQDAATSARFRTAEQSKAAWAAQLR